MRLVILALLAAIAVTGGSGCHGFHNRADPSMAYSAGPPVGTVTYPYYTTRGPRDYLANDPPSIGR